MLDAKAKPHDHALNNAVLVINADMRNDNPDVAYYDKFNFLVQELELAIELKHLMLIVSFATSVGQELGSSLTTVHPIFLSLLPDSNN